MVNINIKSTNFNLTNDIEDYVREKVSSIERLIDLQGEEDILAKVEIERSTHQKKGDVFRFEINLSFKGKVVRSESRKHEPRVAIDDAMQQLEKRVRRSKGKRFELFMKGARKIKSLMKRNENI